MKTMFPLAGWVFVLTLAACHESDSNPPAAIELGDPLPGLTQAELAAFERGRILFERRFTPEEGLGPLYNATSCSSCHSKPGPGGSSELYRNFYVAQWTLVGTVFSLPGLPSPIVPAFGSGIHATASFTLEGGRPLLPQVVSGVPVTSAQRNSIPIFGVGLFEFISDATILANADPEDLDGDGISGRANNDTVGMGRFGVKAQSNSIEVFTRAPLQNQMGITSEPVLGSAGVISAGASASVVQGTFNPDFATLDNDGVPDPEISTQDLADLIAFSRFLAPPQKQPFDEAAVRGEALFEQLGCVGCHIPSLPSSRGPVEAYTDLLIHDMGPELADNLVFGTPQLSPSSPLTAGTEFRTQPLWGVSKFSPYLHDGRAATLDEAIAAHGGEAEAIRDAYLALTPAERDDVIAFLEHL